MSDKDRWPLGAGMSNANAGAWFEHGRKITICFYRPGTGDYPSFRLSEDEAVALAECLQFCLNELYGHKDISDE